jgi:Domain of unknown function (DUF222)/HNH endonuclease
VVDPIPDGRGIALRLVELRREIDERELEFSRLAAEFDKTAWWDDEGFNTAADWIRFNCHMNSNAVWNAFAVGGTAPEMPATVQAMHDGQIGFAHVATMARTAVEVGGAFDKEQLLPLAREHSPGRFFHKCLHYRHAVDAAGYNRDQDRLADARGLRLNTAHDGCVLIRGLLDPAGGAAVRAALEPLARPSGEHDHRTRPQRWADALEDLATGGRPAEIQVTATIETLKGMAGAPGAEMDLSVPISSVAVQRMACDCSVTRVLLSEDSMVIDVGRSKRLVDGALRKALAVRDKHCQWPECERPASWCDGHHLVHWIAGGETNLDNCVLLCKRHHRMVHEGGWQLVRADDGRIVSVAPTTIFGGDRGPD